MKSIKYLIILFILLIANVALAQSWWSANAVVNVSATRVDGSVLNGLNRPIYCVGRVIGTTYYGNTLWSSMSSVIYPGHYSYVYVYTNNNNPFIGGDANIQCRWY